MSRIVNTLTDYVIKKGMVNEKERSVYEYGFLVMLETALSLLISLVIASLLHMFIEGILFFIIFIPLRSYAGGLHLDKYLSCLILSCLTFSVVLLIVKVFIFPVLLLFVIFLVLILSVWLLYPVDNINRSVDIEEEHYFKKRLLKFLILDLIIVIGCVILLKDKYLLLITATFLMMLISMMLGKYKNRKVRLSSNKKVNRFN